jgi:hypothetical protein
MPLDWGTLAGQLSALGASTETVNMAMRGMEHQSSASAPAFAAANPAVNAVVAQQRAALAQLQANERAVDLQSLDLSGLWIGAQGYWMEVTGKGSDFPYVGRDLLNSPIETGVLRKVGRTLQCVGQNATMGQFTAPLAVVNRDLLAVMQNGLPVLVLRRISKGSAAPYLGG